MRKLVTLITAITAIVMAASCSRGERDYSRWQSLPTDGWAYGDTLYLLPVDTGLPDNDTLVRRSLHLGLTHDNDYPYSNVWLEVAYTGSADDTATHSISPLPTSTDDGSEAGSDQATSAM